MVTHFITIDVDLPSSAMPSRSAIDTLHRSILTELQQWGEPLRWAITDIDMERQKAQIEAIVTTTTDLLIPGATVRTV
ncbi:hypothetical protein [Thermocoleostomius sinensis]|uniref:Uncharacterized protein n=1 Tax=Thermocoleostomius sinensis A174 TaxID=2016057 RepID=A0A9E8ZJ90_9CYAN|nr:hypothetical protein [Thermocoleostomius sinensis]WAL62235.1 hypothetical protein OXH18_09670 [Thermocoleostomius sinensis A174]